MFYVMCGMWRCRAAHDRCPPCGQAPARCSLLRCFATRAANNNLALRARHDGVNEVEDERRHVRRLERGEDHLEGVLCVRVPDDERELHGAAAPAVDVGVAVGHEDAAVLVAEVHGRRS